MATTIQEIVGYRNLTGLITDPRGGVPTDVLPPQFMRVTRRIVGYTCTYRKVTGTRQVARIAHYGSASQRRQLKNVSDQPIKLLHSIEHEMHDVTVLTQLENYENSGLQQLGRQEIARQVLEFRQLFNNLRISCMYSTLALGAVYFDADGDLLASSSGAVTSIDWSLSSDHKDQLGGIIGTTWATDSTDIIGDVIAIKEKARKDTGYPIRHAFYGANIVDYIATNTALKNMINGSARLSEGFAAGDIPNGLLGLQWHPAYGAFYEDADGTNQDWFGGDTIVFTPEPSPEWWEVIEGSYAVPRNVNVASDATGAIGSFATVTGMFSHAHPTVDPPGIKHIAGDTFLTVLKVPDAIFIADVVP